MFGENISFDASLVLYIYTNSTNIPPIIIINTIYETDTVAFFLPGQAKDLSAPLFQNPDKSLAQPTSPCILFDGQNILFDASLVICMYK